MAMKYQIGDVVKIDRGVMPHCIMTPETRKIVETLYDRSLTIIGYGDDHRGKGAYKVSAEDGIHTGLLFGEGVLMPAEPEKELPDISNADFDLLLGGVG